MILTFPVQVPPGFRASQAITPAGKACVPGEPPWRPRIWDSFLAPRGEYKHHAIDITAAEGTPVVATASGRVIERWKDLPGAGWSEKGGWYVWFKDDNGYTHYYSHLQKRPAVSSGQRVSAGQLIGYVGKTGNAKTTCPHLHYAITNPAGHKENPYPLLKPMYDLGAWISEKPARAAGGAGALLIVVTAGAGLWYLLRQR